MALAVISAEFLYFASAYIVGRSGPEVVSFRRLVNCIAEVDKAIGNPPATNPRKQLAKKVLACANSMLLYRPVIPIAPYKRIMSQEAIRASQVLKELEHPVILGDDEELRQVKVALARAAIRVGTTYWVQVGDLGNPTTPKHVQVRAALGSPPPLLVGVVVPLAAALIAALV